MADSTGPEDQDLERLMRAGLDRHADEVDTAVPVAARARSAARRRRTTRIVAGAGALAVAAALVTAVVVDRTGPDPDGGGLVVDSPSPDPLPTGWRTEYWHDTQIDVPDDWGWGTAPLTLRQNGREESTRFFCGGPGAMVLADGSRQDNADPSVPYVGRPIMLSDLCVGDTDPGTPSAPYVWLGAAIEPGTVDLGDGWVQETREVNGSTVTVGSDEDALRERILASATGGETCPANLEKPPTVDSMLTEGMGTVHSAQVCAYSRRDGHGLELVYATTLDAHDAAAYADAIWAAPAPGNRACAPSNLTEYVVVTVTGDDPFGTEPVTQDSAITLGCDLVERAPGDYAALTEAATRPWSRNGLQAVLFHFIGMLG